MTMSKCSALIAMYLVVYGVGDVASKPRPLGPSRLRVKEGGNRIWARQVAKRYGSRIGACGFAIAGL